MLRVKPQIWILKLQDQLIFEEAVPVLVLAHSEMQIPWNLGLLCNDKREKCIRHKNEQQHIDTLRY